MSRLLSLCLGIALGGALGGCRTIQPDAPVEGASEACCTHADFELKNFKGCRIPGRRHCGGEEMFWMRGNVVCGAVDEAQCEGGRCCSYRPIYDPSLGRTVSPDDATTKPTEATEPASTEPAEPASTEPAEPTSAEPAEPTSAEPASTEPAGPASTEPAAATETTPPSQ